MATNVTILVGRLTADPVLNYLRESGKAVAKFNLAVDRRRREDGADFVPIVCWEKLAENCANNLGKGRLVAVTGRLQIREYEKDGSKRKATEVVAQDVQFLDWPKDGQTAPPADAQHGSDDLDVDDDIPF